MSLYTIDLLQGGGLPLRSRPGKVALMLIPMLIPFFAGGLIAATWQHREAVIKTEVAAVEHDKEQLKRFQQDLDTYKIRKKQILDLQHRLRAVNGMLETEMTVSPILLELVRTLPETVYFQDVELEYKPESKREKDKETKKKTYIRIVQRSLNLTLAGPGRIESDQAVDRYISDLRENDTLKNLISEIGIVSRYTGRIDDQEQVFFKIECQLKEQTSKSL